ncbi:MAG TPA: hypothetical protein VGI72_02140 [Gaiellales bacterium]|jgi:hypothetical protein
MAEPDDEPLAELRLQRHRDLVGRRFGPLVVRGIVATLTLFAVLAALNVFGQRPATSQADERGVRLVVSTPARVRGGLIFQTRIDVHTSRRIAKPTLVLGGGWFDGMTLNSYQPPATAQTPRGSAVTFTYPPLHERGHMTVWLEWSVNPTNLAWSRPESIALDDGATRLVDLTRTITVFP